MEKEINEIKKQTEKVLCESNIKLEKIILFGSHARGDYSEFSDYDILIIIKDNLTYKDKIAISEKIRDGLAKMLIPTDIIIKSGSEIEYLKNKIGSVVNYSLAEGISL